MRGAGLVILIPITIGAAIFLAFAILPTLRESMSRAARVRDAEERRRTENRRRTHEEQMRRWQQARPTGEYRRQALTQVADAYADERLTLTEHEDRVAAITEATTNAQIEAMLRDLEVVERPES